MKPTSADEQYELGLSYCEGSGAPGTDYLLAAKWLSLAANQGHISAQWVLANIYYVGGGGLGLLLIIVVVVLILR